ncbi:hypothetical protein, partial [Sporisorium scitamineum]
MLEKAQEACERLQDYLHDVRLGTLDPYNVFEVWYILEGPGELVSQYWSRNMLPGLMKDDVKLLKLLHARVFTAYLAVSNDFFFKHRWDNLSDVREPIAMAAPPLLLFDFKNAKYPLHIAT